MFQNFISRLAYKLYKWLDNSVEIIRGDLRVSWVELGEGKGGEYNPNDPSDEELLRFDVHIWNEETQEWIEDQSYCTWVSVKATPVQRYQLLVILMDRLEKVHKCGESLRYIAAELSWMDLSWLKKGC